MLAEDVRLIDGWEPARALAHVLEQRRGHGVIFGGVCMEAPREAFAPEEVAEWTARYAEPWWGEVERLARIARVRVEVFAGTSPERVQEGYVNLRPSFRLVSSRSTLARTAAAFRLARGT